MAKYLCIRTCFVNERLWQQDVVYDLPDEMSKQHFQPVESAPLEAPAQKPEPVKPENIPNGMYWCSKCETMHRESSKVGKAHLKHKA